MLLWGNFWDFFDIGHLQLKSAELDVKGEQCEVHVARHRWLLGVEQLLTLSTLKNWGTFEKIHMSRRMPFSSLAMFNRVGLCKMPLNIRWQIDMCALKSLTYLAPSSCGASGWQAPRPAPPIHIPLFFQNCRLCQNLLINWYFCPWWIWSSEQPGLTAWSWRRQSRGWNRSRYSICILWVHVLVINHHMCLCHHHKYQDEQDQWGHLCKGASLFISLWSLTRLSLHISLMSSFLPMWHHHHLHHNHLIITTTSTKTPPSE